MKSADDFLGLFSGVKKTGQGLWNVRCPSHNDGDKPDDFSLSVKELPDKILIHCHAGCNYKAVLRALKLTESDLFFDNPKANTSVLNKSGKIVALYNYLDEDGELLHQTVRFEPKKFSQRRPGKKDEWIWNLRGVNPVIYHLPRVKEAIENEETIFLSEGEKDADNLASHLGLVATTSPMGAGKWRETYAQMLSGAKEVVVIADNDSPGQRHAQAIASSLLALQVPTKLLKMPSADIKDISDWISAGLTADQLKETTDGLLPYEMPTPTPSDSGVFGHFRLTDLGNAERLIHQFGDILHYSYERKLWLIWSGKVWEWDMGDKIMQLATKTVRNIYHEVANEPDDKKRKELTDHAKRSESDQRLGAMIKLARARPGIPVEVAKLNTDAWLLNCSNGTINLKTGKLQPYNKRDLITMLIPLSYHAEARSEEWDSFLGTIFEHRESIISYVQKALGYSITGSQEEQAFFFCHGSGWNGKST